MVITNARMGERRNMKTNNCSECKRWKKAMEKYNKVMGKTIEECNRYGICNKSDEIIEWDDCFRECFKKSKLLSIQQWLYEHGIKTFK